MNKGVVLVSVFVVFVAFSIVPVPAAADTASGTETIDEGEYYYWTLSYTYSGNLYYTISNSYGDPYFDVYVLTPYNFGLFEDGEYFTYTECSDEYTSYADVSCSVTSGTWYLVVDNSYRGSAYPDYYESLTFTYSIETVQNKPSNGGNGGETENFMSSAICLGIAIFGIIMIIVIVAVAMSRRRRTVAPAPPPPTAYPPQQQPAPPPGQHYGHQQAGYTPPPSQPQYQQQQQRQSQPERYDGPPAPAQAPEPAHAADEPAKAADYPDLELPGIMGGTRGTLEETYSGPPKPPGQK